MMNVEETEHKATLFAEDPFELSAPRLAKKICLEHLVEKDGHIEHFQTLGDEAR